jgi:hypothetical protein
VIASSQTAIVLPNLVLMTNPGLLSSIIPGR